MHKSFRFFVSAFFFAAFLISGASAQDENAARPAVQANRANYEVVVQLLKSVDAAERSNLPANLAPVARKLKSDFGATSEYRVLTTLVNRVSEKGQLEIKSLSPFDQLQNQSDRNLLTFYDLSLNGIQSNQTDANQAHLDFLRFGIRVPILVAQTAQDGKSVPVYNYEQLGITAKPLSVAYNEPTVVGTLTTARLGELLILVLTVKPENRALAKKN
jgi:hypothetical protein